MRGRTASRTNADAREAMLPLIPRLRAAARELAGDPVAADELVTATLAEALVAWDDVEPGAALETWLLLILGDLAVVRGRGGAAP